MKAKKRFTYVCSLTDAALKIIKCVYAGNLRPEFIGVQVELLPADADDKKINSLLHQALKKLGYEHHPIIVCLPRAQATCRYIKIPAVLPQEIEKMSALQASRYLPYPANELVTGFDVISTEKEGYSHINLTIVHKNIIERLLKIFKELKSSRLSIVLSSYALLNLHLALNPGDSDTVMIIDVDTQAAELAVISSKKLLFSRSVKLNRDAPAWMDSLFDEINKTQDTYLETVTPQAIRKFALVGIKEALEPLRAGLENKFSLPVEILSLSPKIKVPADLSDRISNAPASLAALIGFCLKEAQGSLDLLPQDVKSQTRKLTRRKKGTRTFLFVLIIILTWGIGVAKHLDNKAMYLARLKSELSKISKQAKPLEDIERRFDLLERRSLNKPQGLEILYELHQIVPAQVALVSLSYEENKQVVLRGQSPELNPLLAFVKQMEQSGVFKSFHIKVRYATKKKTPLGELVDFEIECQKR